MRILIRREEIEESAQLSLFEQTNGYRYQVMATAGASGDNAGQGPDTAYAGVGNHEEIGDVKKSVSDLFLSK
jgi:hypothetical protein